MKRIAEGRITSMGTGKCTAGVEITAKGEQKRYKKVTLNVPVLH